MKNSRVPQRTILFVDDEPAILAVERLLFEGLGYVVLTAGSGEEALSVMQGHSVDAVVLDYLMPTLDGEETARRIRTAHGDIPIVIATGLGFLPEPLMSVVDGSVDKGKGLEELVAVVEKLLYSVN